MLQPNNYLNQEALKQWDEKHLEEYTLYLEQQLANLAVYYAQVRLEWGRREDETRKNLQNMQKTKARKR